MVEEAARGRGQGRAGNKEADGGGARPSVCWPQLASQLAHCPLHTHKETQSLPVAAAALTPARSGGVATPLGPARTAPFLLFHSVPPTMPLGTPFTLLGDRWQPGRWLGGPEPRGWRPGQAGASATPSPTSLPATAAPLVLGGDQ